MVSRRGSDALTERERTALGMLARGHTVKSTAAEMDLSDNAVAELLRSARRKLGAGSSREAARLMVEGRAAPKTGDMFSGVAGGHGATQPAARTPGKGSIAMYALTVIAIAAGVLFVANPRADRPTQPQVVASTPADGGTIAPGPFALSVTFDRPMQRMNYSFATGPENRFPRCAPKVTVSGDGRTFTMRCTARIGESYVVWANHGRFANFRSIDGVAALPTRIAFSVGAPD